MANVFQRNCDVARAWADRRVEWARTTGGAFSYDSYDVLYSYNMPIAWRTDRNKVIVRCTTESPSVTTSRHISHIRGCLPSHGDKFLINVPVDTYEERWGIGLEDIIDYDYRIQDIDRVTFARKEKGEEKVYTHFVMDGGYLEDTPLMCRGSLKVAFCVAGESIPTPTELVQAVVPPEHHRALFDGWVAYAGDMLFVGDPTIKTRDLPGKIEHSACVSELYSATDLLGGHVRGVVWYKDPDIGETIQAYSANMDGRPGASKVWHKAVRPLQSTLKRSAGKDLTNEKYLLTF